MRALSFHHSGGLARALGLAVASDVTSLDGKRTAVIVIDARDATERGLVAVAALGARAEACGSALLAIVGTDASADAFFDAGATHFLAAPESDAAIRQAVRFAARHAERTAAGERRADHGGSGDTGSDDVRAWLDARMRDGARCSVVLVALSRLDLVNAAHGRPAVDGFIQAAAARIAAAADAIFEEGTRVARIDGAHLVLAAAATGERVAQAAAAVGAALARPFDADGGTTTIGSRFAVAEQEAGDDAGALLRRAGDALAVAKASDGAVFRVAGASGVAPLDRLAVDLHHAIDGAQIGVLFQPQVEIASGRTIGVEALARWDHPLFGPLGADTLFAAADRADLGIALSDHIQQLTLARAARWPRVLAALRLSINLTAADITRSGFAAIFLARVDASGFARERLTVEITETGMIEDLAAAAALLAELRGAGCRVAIDDFGTGYSSLAYLKTLPLDYLKIDRALALDIEGSPRDRVVVRGVIAMARSLGMAVIAEGVETEAQAALLGAEGCAYYQGYLRSVPVDEAGLTALMEAEA